MTFNRLLLIALFLATLALPFGCGGGGGGGSDSPPAPAPTPTPIPSLPTPQGNNVVRITVNGSLCTRPYVNKPCVAVTICSPDNSTCQTVNDILVDTASFGLRVFAQALSVPLTQVTVGSGSLAECVAFGDGSVQWGSVQLANVVLGSEPAVQVPIHVVDANFPTVPASCTNQGILEASADTAHFNGILGVGVLKQDCGTVCTNRAQPIAQYFSCTGSGCSATNVPLASQVQNPVALLPGDNNGVIVQLPAVGATGAPSVEGHLLLGIGTQANNAPSAGVTLGVSSRTSRILTAFNGSTMNAFFDTGSNGLFFPRTSALPDCASTRSWFCPASTVDLTADLKGISGSPSNTVSFQIGNFLSLISSNNFVFPDVGGNDSSLPAEFDWGLPFHLGRNVHYGIEGTASSLGTGPYYAY